MGNLCDSPEDAYEISDDETDPNAEIVETILDKTVFGFYLSNKRLVELQKKFSVLEIPEGELVYRRGDEVEGFYIITSGTVRISIEEKFFSYLHHENDIFGELDATRFNFPHMADLFQEVKGANPGAVDERPTSFFTLDFSDYARHNTATAVTDLKLLFCPYDAFKSFLKRTSRKSQKECVRLVTRDLRSYIKTLPMFKKVAPSILATVSSLFAIKVCDPLTKIYQSGDKALEVSVLLKGRAILGVPESISLKENDFIGLKEYSLAVPRFSDCVVSVQSLLITMPQTSYLQILKLFPELEFNFMEYSRTLLAGLIKSFYIPFLEAEDALFNSFVKMCQVRVYKEKEDIIKEGCEVPQLILLLTGSVHCVVERGNGFDPYTLKYEKEQYLGEFPFLKKINSTGTYTCMENSTAILVSREAVDFLTKESENCQKQLSQFLDKFDINLRSILQNEAGLAVFSDHMNSEYAMENVNFWVEVQTFVKKFHKMTPAERMDMKNSIMENYVFENSANQVNLKSVVLQALLERNKLPEVSIGFFDDAEYEIVFLMSQDSYKRFQKGKYFQVLLSKMITS